MGTDMNLNALWRNQKVPDPNINELKSKLDGFRSKRIKRAIIVMSLLLAVVIGSASVWLFFQPEMWATRVGLICILTALVIFLIAQNKLITYYKSIPESMNPTQFVAYLLKIKSKELHLQTTILNGYFILISIGFLLYLYEYTSKMASLQGLIYYICILLWIALNWFFIRPRQIKKHQLEINELLHHYHKISDQFKDI